MCSSLRLGFVRKEWSRPREVPRWPALLQEASSDPSLPKMNPIDNRQIFQYPPYQKAMAAHGVISKIQGVKGLVGLVRKLFLQPLAQGRQVTSPS